MWPTLEDDLSDFAFITAGEWHVGHLFPFSDTSLHAVCCCLSPNARCSIAGATQILEHRMIGLGLANHILGPPTYSQSSMANMKPPLFWKFKISTLDGIVLQHVVQKRSPSALDSTEGEKHCVVQRRRDGWRKGREEGRELPYMISAEKGGGVKKCSKFADTQFRFCRQQGGRGQKFPKSCGYHIWKPPRKEGEEEWCKSNWVNSRGRAEAKRRWKRFNQCIFALLHRHGGLLFWGK